MADWLRSLRAHRHGHSYHDMHIGGNARVHNGDVHGNIVIRTVNSQDRDIIHWLQPPDSTVDHFEARHKHEPGTGTWFLYSTEYMAWLKGHQRALWLRSKAGCGKTILCSSAIHDVDQYVRHNRDIAMAYFYFSFANQKKQSYMALVTSLIAQLVRDCDPPKELLTAFREDQRSVHILEQILVQLVDKKTWTYVPIDALDECTEEDDRRQEVLDGLRRLVSSSPKIKLLGTSRDVVDIADFMGNWPIVSVAVSNGKVNADIELYLDMEMKRDRRLEKLPKHTKAEIQESFSAKADGMFRWANCQLTELKRLKIHRPDNIARALHNMPATLDVTYDRLLESIDENHRKDAKTALTWLVFAQRPLRIEELVEACIVDEDDTSRVDVHSRSALYGIVEVLSSLVEITSTGYNKDQATANQSQSLVKLAHFTVREYLTSDRNRSRHVQYFALSEANSHQLILRTCVKYLLQLPDLIAIVPEGQEKVNVPRVRYAATYWDEHLGHAKLETPQTIGSCRHVELLEDNAARALWLLVRVEDSWKDKDTQPLYWAALFGLVDVVQYLCNFSIDVNHVAGRYGSALQAACVRGHADIVRILLQEGALVNLRAGEWGTPLKAACRKGRCEVVSLLIQAGAEVNTAQGKYGSALHMAAAAKNVDVMRLLLEAGADVNITGGAFFSTPLIESCQRRDGPGALFLLQHGASVTGFSEFRLDFIHETVEASLTDLGGLGTKLIEYIEDRKRNLARKPKEIDGPPDEETETPVTISLRHYLNP